MNTAYLDHIKSSKDLETTYEAVRAGFVALALEKNRRATPFMAAPGPIKSAALKAKTPRDLLKMVEIRPGLLTAAGVSDKAVNHLQGEDKTEAIIGLVNNFLEPAGSDFVEELVFRFLLTRGDTLGGSMRNVGGFMAQCKLTRAIISHLKITGRKYEWLHVENKVWAKMPEKDADIEQQIKGLCWEQDGKQRTLLYNLTVPLVKNNVDLSLFNCSPMSLAKSVFSKADAYVALGELKGGIDPAGADEHWKTARTALGRIHDAFSRHKAKPQTFFIGGAIEAKMATEIWTLLENGVIDNAANLTSEAQITSISRWLCNL